MAAFKTILVATDFSAPAEAAVDRACELADLCGADLHLLHVVSRPSLEPWVGYVASTWLEEDVDREKRDAETRLGSAVTSRGAKTPATIAVTVGEPAAEIIAYATAHRTDLIVCGTHGRHGLNRLVLGSIAEHVVHNAPCAVLTVKPERAAPAEMAGDAMAGEARQEPTR
jgi:nucleotide-binding universal stress UspA family protein